MVTTLAQVVLLTASGFASLRGRPGPPLALAFSTACAVAVFLATIALATGIERTLNATAHPARALVVSSVSSTEGASFLQAHEVAAVRSYDDFTVISPELLLSIPQMRRKHEDEVFRLPKRGVTKSAFQLRPEVEIVAGRMMEPGKWETIVGIRAAREFAGLALGDTVQHHDAPHVDWTVVGHFTAGGGMHETELWVDKAALTAYGWEGDSANVVWVELHDSTSLAAVDRMLHANPLLVATHLVSEGAFFDRFGAQATAPLRIFAAVVGAVMALGAVSAAVYASATAVAARRLEIATMRAIGISAVAIGVAIVGESVLVAAVGGLLGVAFVYAAFDGVQTASTLGTAAGPLVYSLSVSVGASLVALSLAIGTGFVGAFGAVAHAVRLDVASALRAVQ